MILPTLVTFLSAVITLFTTASGARVCVRRKSTNFVIIHYDYTDDKLLVTDGLWVGLSKQDVTGVMIDTSVGDFLFGLSVYSSGDSSSLHDLGTSYSPSDYGIDANIGTETFGGPYIKKWNVTELEFGYTEDETVSGSLGGVLGIGYPAVEEITPSYSNFPFILKDQEVISTVMYAIADDKIVFGGIDTLACPGPLVKTPVARVATSEGHSSIYQYTAVTMNSMKVNNVVVSHQKLIMNLDSSVNVLKVPYAIWENFDLVLGKERVYRGETGYYLKSKLEATTVQVSITGYTIEFSMADLIDEEIVSGNKEYASIKYEVIDLEAELTGTLPNVIFEKYCVVVDMESNEILFTEQNSGSDGNVKPVKSDIYPVPTTTASSYSETYSTFYNPALETVVNVNQV